MWYICFLIWGFFISFTNHCKVVYKLQYTSAFSVLFILLQVVSFACYSNLGPSPGYDKFKFYYRIDCFVLPFGHHNYYSFKWLHANKNRPPELVCSSTDWFLSIITIDWTLLLHNGGFSFSISALWTTVELSLKCNHEKHFQKSISRPTWSAL